MSAASFDWVKMSLKVSGSLNTVHWNPNKNRTRLNQVKNGFKTVLKRLKSLNTVPINLSKF